MKIVFTDAAKADLRDIGDWIAEDNPVRARSFIVELRQKTLSIALNPRLYPIALNLEIQGIRRRLYKGYLIFYRVSEKRIEILHILHGARDYEALMGDDDSHTKE